MTLKQQENIRLAILLASFGTSILSSTNAYDMIGFTTFLENNGLTIEDIHAFLGTLGNISLFSAGWLENITKEHKEIKCLYNEIIDNTGNLFREFGVDDDPIKTFALYVYLYRLGYFSVNHKFVYKFEMKDFARLGGVDVVLGTGVCRSIASMFTDICRNLGMNANSISVKVRNKNMQGERERLCPIELEHEDKDNFLSKVMEKAIDYVPIGNHMITEIFSNGINMGFDPTNDYLLYEGKIGRLNIAGSTGCYMTKSYVSGTIPVLLGQSNGNLFMKRTDATREVSFLEYKEIYKDLLHLMEKSIDLFEMFYLDNLSYYKEIENVARTEHSMIKRYIPIIPGK